MKNNDSPFLGLLEHYNLSKIKIDMRLIPVFSDVIKKIDKYFKEDGLMNTEWINYWREFF